MIEIHTGTRAVDVALAAIPELLVMVPIQPVPADQYPVNVYLSRLDE
jgi:hypothetical protein